MAARAISTATISFGLVSIPVKLYSSSETSGEIHFNQMDKKDGARLKQQLVNSRTGNIVQREEIVKGYEFSKGQYVLFNPEELKAIEATANNTVDITEFVHADQVERTYFDKLYFLGPDKGGARAYKLLGQALRETGRVALAKYAARGKQYLVMVRPMERGLVLEQLRYPSEVRSFAEVPVDDVELKPAELKLAVQLIEQAASEEFHPEQYKDEVRERMLALIQRKVEGEDITVTPTEEPEHKIIDIMEALKASLAASGKGGAARKPARRAEAKAADAEPAAAAKPAKSPSKKKAARG
jgi:DNA end-binding protein Ku